VVQSLTPIKRAVQRYYLVILKVAWTTAIESRGVFLTCTVLGPNTLWSRRAESWTVP
jgi:hypothetical protein